MKKIALLAIVMIIATGFVLTSCDYNNSNSNNNSTCSHNWQDATTSAPKTCTLCGETEGEPLSALDVLNEDEMIVYDEMISFANSLNNPASLRLIDLRVGVTSGSDKTEKVFVKLSANNAFGSPVAEVFVMNVMTVLNQKVGYLDTSGAGSGWYDLASSYYHTGSVSKINAALQAYFKEMGWL